MTGFQKALQTSIGASAARRFTEKVDFSGECWEWTASKTIDGYGHFGYDGTVRIAHRFAYQAVTGADLSGLHVDHLCRNRGCVNPAHLEAVTPGENARRGETGAHNGSKTHCAKGHAYDEANTYWRKGGGRHCRTCLRDRKKKAVAA